MARYRLSTPEQIDRWAGLLQDGLASALTVMRRELGPVLDASGASWDSPLDRVPAGLWNDAMWASAVEQGMGEAAATVAVEAQRMAQSRFPDAATVGAPDQTSAYTRVVLARAIAGGERIGRALHPQPPAESLVAAGAKLSSIRSALEGAAASLDTIVARSAGQVVSAASADTAAVVVANTGADLTQEWVTMGDDRVRDIHDDMDGQVQSVGAPFEDGDGNLLMYPGDPGAPDYTTENCRCELFLQGATDTFYASTDWPAGGNTQAISDALADAVSALD